MAKKRKERRVRRISGLMPGQARIVGCQGCVQDGATPENEKWSDAVTMAFLFGGSPEGKGVERHGDGVGLRTGLAEERIPFAARSAANAGMRGFNVGDGGGGKQAERKEHSGRRESEK